MEVQPSGGDCRDVVGLVSTPNAAQTGKLTEEQPRNNASLPSYMGRFTVWGNFNQNGTTVNGTSTFNLTGWGSDGSMISNHENDHFNVRPDGSVNEFFHCH